MEGKRSTQGRSELEVPQEAGNTDETDDEDEGVMIGAVERAWAVEQRLMQETVERLNELGVGRAAELLDKLGEKEGKIQNEDRYMGKMLREEEKMRKEPEEEVGEKKWNGGGGEGGEEIAEGGGEEWRTTGGWGEEYWDAEGGEAGGEREEAWEWDDDDDL